MMFVLTIFVVLVFAFALPVITTPLPPEQKSPHDPPLAAFNPEFAAAPVRFPTTATLVLVTVVAALAILKVPNKSAHATKAPITRTELNLNVVLIEVNLFPRLIN